MAFNCSSSGTTCSRTLAASAARSSSLAILGLQGPGQAQRRVQVRLALEPMLAARRIKGRKIAGDQLAIVSGLRLRGAIDGERQIDVAADEIFFQHPAQLHFQRVKAGGKAELQIEKAMIDALYGERVAELILIAKRHANLHPRKSGHRRNGHSYSCAPVASAARRRTADIARGIRVCVSGMSMNCNW